MLLLGMMSAPPLASAFSILSSRSMFLYECIMGTSLLGNRSDANKIDIFNSQTGSFTGTSFLVSLEESDKISTTTRCQDGALMPELAVPGAYNNACMSMSERKIPIGKSSGSTLTIRQQASGSGSTGLAVWNSALLMTRLVAALFDSSNLDRIPNLPKSISELGTGTALVSCALGRLLPDSQILATDGNPNVVSLAKTNIELNQLARNVQAQQLQWGLLNAMDYSETFDLVVGSDLTYNSGTWRVLAETMETILKDDGYILYLSLGHDGFNVNAELDGGFLSVAKEQVGLVEVPTYQGISVTSLLDQIILPSERKQILSSGVRVVVLQKSSYLKRLAKERKQK